VRYRKDKDPLSPSKFSLHVWPSKYGRVSSPRPQPFSTKKTKKVVQANEMYLLTKNDIDGTPQLF
jgi:hypothetical protein